MRHSLPLLLSLSVAATGCLSRTHRIPKSELTKLASMAPEQRGESVRVIQNLGHQEDPPEAGHVQTTTVVYVGAPVWIDGRPHPHRRSSGVKSVTHSGTGVKKTPGGRGFGDLGKQKSENAKAWLILAGVAAVALAATEGARYDGWVKLHPMMPVHLFGPYGEYAVVPLAQIDPQTAQWASRAYVREGEGPWQPMGRAPLNRQGFTYSVLLGGGEVPIKDLGTDPGFLGHIQFGYFFTNQIGLNLDLGMGWTEDPNGATVFDSRTALELQAYLVKAGPLHAGLFGQGGVAGRSDDGIGLDQSDNLFGGGAQLQLDWTTRLALTLRAGTVRMFDEWNSELGLGLSIY
jgi:hypothetical protein